MDINIGRIQLVCNRYGLDYNEALCGSNVVVVPGSVKNIYVSFDKEGNVVDVRRHFAINENVVEYFDNAYDIFSNSYLSSVSICDDDFSKDTKVSFNEIIKITDKYRYDKSYLTTYVTEEDNLDENQKNLVSFLTLLRGVGDKYNSLHYQMLSCGVNTPDFKSYTRFIINSLNNYIDECLKENKKPNADEFINLSGQINLLLIYRVNLEDAINLLLKIKGYVINDNDEVVPEYCIVLADLLDSMREKIEDNKESDKLKQNVKMIK